MSELSQFDILQERLDVSAEYVIYCLMLSLILVLYGYLEMHITNFIGIIFPVYWSIKSIESPREGDDSQWFTYWSLFLPNLILDLIFGDILILIPYFYFIKLIFFIWLFLPNTRGALFLHNTILIRYFGKIDLQRFNRLLLDLYCEMKEISISLIQSLHEVYIKILEVDIEGGLYDTDYKDKVQSIKIEKSISQN